MFKQPRWTWLPFGVAASSAKPASTPIRGRQQAPRQPPLHHRQQHTARSSRHLRQARAMASMLPTARAYFARSSARAVLHGARPFCTTIQARNQGQGTGENREQANDPLPPKQTPNVSMTDEVKTDAMGARDAPLQELAPDAEKKRELQAPNRQGVWSRSQQPREQAMTGPRFEQTIMELQVRGWSHRGAMDPDADRHYSHGHLQLSSLYTNSL